MNMKHKMGNNNTSGIKEEEKAVDEVLENGQGALHAEQLKTENHASQEAHAGDFCERGADLSSNDGLDARKALAEGSESIEKGEEIPEGSKESRNPTCPDNDIAPEASGNEASQKKLVELNLEETLSLGESLQIPGQQWVAKELDTEEVGKTKLPEPHTTSQISEAANDSKGLHEVIQNSPSTKSEEVPELNTTAQISEAANDSEGILEVIQNLPSTKNEELMKKIQPSILEIENTGNENQSADNVEDILQEQSGPLEEKVLQMNICVEKCCTDDNLEHGPENQGDSAVDTGVELSSSLDTETEEQDKCITRSEENELFACIESENEGIKRSLRQADSSKQTEIHTIKGPVELDERCCNEIGEQTMFQLSSTPGLHKDYKNKSLLAESIIEKYDNTEEASANSPVITSFPTELSFTDKELAMIDQELSGTMGETGNLSEQSIERYPISERLALPDCEAQETADRVVIRSNGPRKSPSFDFGNSFVLRSEESDQTPLLHHDKNAARSSFSGYSNLRSQSNTLQLDYFRKSLDFEPVEAEEKTIRMERSDSDISRSSLMKRDENVNVESSQKKQEYHAADEKAIELPAEEPALTMQKIRGKRKPKSTLFSTCICCTAHFD